MYKGITNAPDILYELGYYDVADSWYSFMSNIDCGEQTIEVYADDVLIVSGILAKANYKDDIYESDIIATTQSALVEANVYKIVLAGTEHHLYLMGKRVTNLPPNFYCIYAEETGDGVEFRAITSAATDISVSKTITKSVKRYDTKLLPDYLLPTTAARKSDVSKAAAVASAAQTAADNAQATANNAQATANNAQATANLSNKVLDLYLREGQLRYKAGSSSQPPLQLRDLQLNDFVFNENSLGGMVVAHVSMVGEKWSISGNTLSYPMRYVVSDEHTDLTDTEFVFTSTPIAPTELYLSYNNQKTFKITVNDTGTLLATEVTS